MKSENKKFVIYESHKTICPKCGQNTLYRQPYEAWNAVSRLDNRTYICPECGTLEALETIMAGSPAPKSRWTLPHAPSQSEFEVDDCEEA